VVVDGKRRRRKATREQLMKDLSVMIQEGSSFTYYLPFSDVQGGTAVTLRRAPLPDWEEQEKTLSQRPTYPSAEKKTRENLEGRMHSLE
jgi:hypothetical protein